MAEGREGFRRQRHLLVEAGTELAKRLPTGSGDLGRPQDEKGGNHLDRTKNLQEQLMEKDIPFLQKVLPANLRRLYEGPFDLCVSIPHS